MMVWKLILCPTNPALSVHDIATSAKNLGYPMFNFEGKIYKLTPPPEGAGKDDVAFEETGSVAEMFDMPTVFCVMDGDAKKIAMNEFGPVLFANPTSASLFAEHVKGIPKTLHEAIYLQRQAQKDGSALVLPEEKKLIVPASR